MDCSICLCENYKTFKCSCDCIVCFDCISTNCDILLKENKVPYCFNCYKNIIPTDIEDKITSKKILDCYINSINKEEFLHIFSKRLNSEGLIEEIKAKRKKDILNGFPKCILKTIDIIHPNKFKQMEKKIFTNYDIKFDDKKCFNQFCDGYLIDSFCYKCNISFCDFCEKEKTPFHSCKKEDIDSVEFMKTKIKCPKCKAPCEKISGCNHITCANCQTNFNYTTGEIETSGGHDRNKINEKEKRKLSDYLSNSKFKELVLEFEKLRPKEYDGIRIVKMAKENKDISDELYHYRNHLNKLNYYNKISFEIDILITSKDFNEHRLRRYIEKFQNI